MTTEPLMVPGSRPVRTQGLALHSSSATLYVTSAKDTTVTAITTMDVTVTTTIGVGHKPVSVTVDTTT